MQLRLQLLVVILQDLHPCLQAALVLPEDSCFCQELVVTRVLHGFGRACSQGWRLHCLVVLPFQTSQLSLEDPAGQPRSASPQSFPETAGNTRELHAGDGPRLRQSCAVCEAQGPGCCPAEWPVCGSTPLRGFTDMQPLPRRMKTGAGKASPPPELSSSSPRASPCVFQTEQHYHCSQGAQGQERQSALGSFNQSEV